MADQAEDRSRVVNGFELMIENENVSAMADYILAEILPYAGPNPVALFDEVALEVGLVFGQADTVTIFSWLAAHVSAEARPRISHDRIREFLEALEWDEQGELIDNQANRDSLRAAHLYAGKNPEMMVEFIAGTQLYLEKGQKEAIMNLLTKIFSEQTEVQAQDEEEKALMKGHVMNAVVNFSLEKPNLGNERIMELLREAIDRIIEELREDQ